MSVIVLVDWYCRRYRVRHIGRQSAVHVCHHGTYAAGRTTPDLTPPHRLGTGGRRGLLMPPSGLMPLHACPWPPIEGTRACLRVKGQGQWALGYREPLNPNERAKRDNDGLSVRERIIDIYQHTGFAGIDPGRHARPVPVVRAVHPAPSGHPGRQDRDPRAGRARGRDVHAAHPRRRRCADQRAAARRRRHRARLRPQSRRHHRPAEHPAALDPDRGRPDDLGASSRPSGCRPPRRAATRRA